MADMLIRSVPAQTRDSIKRSARMRGMTLAEYLVALYRLHQDLLKVRPDSEANVSEMLSLNGLHTPKE